MADHGEVTIRQLNLDALVKTYQDTLKSLTTTIVDSTEAGKIRKARTMAQVRRELIELGDNVDAFVKKEIPQYYQDGAAIAIQDLKKLGADVTKGTSVLDRQAIAALVDEVNNAFAEGITAIGRSAAGVLSKAQKMQIQMTIAEGKITGEGAKAISEAVKQNLKDNGLTALVDKGGRRWSFDDYAQMLVRTKGVEARNQGLANRMLTSGYDLVQVSDHNSSHAECAFWEGKILSISGNTPGYPTVAEATKEGLFHPNCQHAINVIQPSLAKETNIYQNDYNSLSQEDKASVDQAFKDRNKK